MKNYFKNLRKKLLIVSLFGFLVSGNLAIAGTESVTNNTSFTFNKGNGIQNVTFSMSSGTITAVTIAVDIDHASRSELDVRLISPIGTEVILSKENGGTG
ncbi:MAG: proprotein convertase P-domain-containing protein, partial [Sulfurovum sp.]|uniref:proprotein convertase P-domain-containing protein n=1 Tax=Sulfurovum sp. TaxID=1969726 RepID=UPI002867D770